MSIPDHARANFQTLLRAAADRNLALMECSDAVTSEVIPKALIAVRLRRIKSVLICVGIDSWRA